MHPVARTAFAALCLVVALACGSSSETSGLPAGPTPPDTTGTGTPPAAGTPSLGVNASLNGYRPFPDDNAWNVPVDTAEVDPNSAAIIAGIGAGTALHPDWGRTETEYGIPYIVVAGDTPRVPVTFDYADESDPGPYPIPPNAPVEGGRASSGDRHVLILDRDNRMLYELWSAYPAAGGGWTAGSGAVFDLSSNVMRPAGWTSADAAGLPIFPGLARYDEVLAGEIRHALRFTVQRTRRAYVSPARHWASSLTGTDLPPMGMRVRLKGGFDTSGYPRDARIVLDALKKYGMILADNGSTWYVSGVSDARWDSAIFDAFRTVHGSDFEVVRMGTIVTP